jgi:hypothetical protein
MRRRSVPAAGERHRRMFSGSVSRILAGCAIALTLAAAGTACAGEAAQIAARGGFLVGHAYRCGVSTEQLRPSTQLMGELIAALAVDGEEQAAADQVFIENLLTTLRSASPDDRVASCALIRRELAQLEQHYASRLHPGSGSNVQYRDLEREDRPVDRNLTKKERERAVIACYKEAGMTCSRGARPDHCA